MRTIADFRRAAVAGSVWQCTNHLRPHVSGERRITGGSRVLTYTGTMADGTPIDKGSMDIPARSAVRIDGDSITWLNDKDGSDAFTWTLQPNEPAEGRSERGADRSGQPEGRHPRFLLTDDVYAARGAVVVVDGRYIGHDTDGRELFNRKDLAGAEVGAKRYGFRLVISTYYGVDRAGADTTAPDIMRRRDAERAAKAEAAVPPVEDVDPVAGEAKCVIRHLQKFTPEQRADRASSHRLGHRQRGAVGSYFYTHPDLPGRSFDTRGAAARAAVAEAGKRPRRVEMYAAKLAAETIRDENNPRPVDPTDDVLAKTFEHCARPAPSDMYDEIRAAYAKLVAAWEDERYTAIKARQKSLLDRPDVAAAAARVAALTADERRALDAAYWPHFQIYRIPLLQIGHRCIRAYGENYHDVHHVAHTVAGPFEEFAGAHHAADAYVRALLWGDLLADHERAIFTGPWVAVIGEGGPRAELPARTEAYVSPWVRV